MKKLILAVIIFASCGGGGSSSAEPCAEKDCPVNVKMVHIDGVNSFDVMTAEKIVSRAIQFVNNKSTVKVKLTSSISIADPLPETGSLAEWYTFNSRYKQLENYLFRNNLLGDYNKRELTVIIDKPLTDSNGVIYTAGRAYVCALYRPKIALTHATPFTNSFLTSGSFDRTPEEMFNRSTNITAHEILHNLGAPHYEFNDCTDCIMTTTFRQDIHLEPSNFITSSQTISSTEICVRRETRRAIVTCRRKDLSRKRFIRCKAKKRIRNIRLRDVKFREPNIRSLNVEHSCNLLGD